MSVHRYTQDCEQLYKDVEGVLEMVCEALLGLQKQPGGKAGQDAALMVPLLELWDGICGCWQGKPKPGAWTKFVFKVAKGFEPDARARAADAAEVSTCFACVMLCATDAHLSTKASMCTICTEITDLIGGNAVVSTCIRVELLSCHQVLI